MRARLLTLVAVSVAGCVDNDISMSIARFADMNAAMCSVTSTTTNIQSSGLLDVGIVTTGIGYRGYMAVPLVTNNMIIRAGPPSTGPSEVDAIQLSGADIELTGPAALAIPVAQQRYFIPSAAGLIQPGGASNTASTAPMTVEMIPAQLASALASSIPSGPSSSPPVMMVRIRAVGKRAGSTITSAFVEFPVYLCRFCLTDVPAPCPTAGFTTTQVQVGGCFPEQDKAVTCCIQGQQYPCGRSVPMRAM